MTFTKLADMFTKKGRGIRAMSTRTVMLRGRATTAVVAATLAVLLTVDPYSMASVMANPLDEGDLSRAERFDAVADDLNLATAVNATELTGSWGALPGSGDLSALPVALPSEDEEVVVLTPAEGEVTSASYRMQAEGDGPVEVDLGGMAVTVGAAGEEVTPDAVLVRVAGETETEAAGVTGVLLNVTDASAASVDDAEVELTVSYADFAGLGGGDWASRLRITWIPDCGTEAIDCTPVPLETVNDLEAQTVTAVVPVGDGEIIEPVSFTFGTKASSRAAGGTGGGSLAVSADASSSSGNWGATSLAQSATWGAGGSTGGFSWSLPFTTPATAAGPVPKLGLSYSSAASDGRTPNSNNQSGLVGEGFDVTSSYVERSYVPCSQDEEGSANNVDRTSGDQCWGTENATMSFNGSAVELIHNVANDTWHSKQEDGTLIEKLTGAWNGGQANEYWKVTTTDGSQYFFGRGQRSATDTTALNSAWTLPVFGNHPGEPCYNSEFSSSRCNQVWRWNLEYVVDPSGNSMTYFYSKETNSYVYDIEGNLDGNIVSYTSGGRLDRIEYGTRDGSESTASAPAKVVFTTSPRCITDLANPDSWCSSTQTSTSSNKWLDTPVDLICSAKPCTNYTPVFFDRYRLNDVSTFGYDGTAYRPVDSWSIAQRFVASGSSGLQHAASPMLITTGVTHTGKGGTSDPTDDLALPPHQFGYVYLDNRVDSTADGVDPLRRPRISDIRTESAASVTVNYRTECSSTNKPGTSEAAQQANTKLCYPVKWAESAYAPAAVEYFHKYVVETIVESGAPPAATGEELITGSLPIETSFTYAGGAAWAKPTGAMVKPAEVSYSDFRGFAEVTTTLGAGDESSSTRSTYFRGVGGDVTAGPPGYTVTAEDSLARKGQAFDTVELDGTSLISETIFVQGDTVVTATDAKGNEATRVPSTESWEFTYLASGAVEFRTGTKTVFDSDSQVVSVEDLGDRSTSADNVCTTTTYAHTANATLASKHLLMQISRSDSFAGSCTGTPSLPADLLRSTKATFDVNGRPLRMETIDPVDGDGYILASEILEYDQLGRALRTSDPLGGVSTVSYEQSDGGLLEASTSTTPDPDGSGPLSGFASSTTFNALTGHAIETADINGRVTSATYDALGRLLTVRYPQHQTTTLPSLAYEYGVGLNGLNSIVTKTLSTDGTTQHVSAALYDGMLRLFQTQIEGKDAGADHNADAAARGRLVSQTYFDSAGRKARQTGQWTATGAPEAVPAFFDTVPPSETTFEYDGAGRTTAETFFVGTSSNSLNEKWSTTTTYDGGTTLKIPPMGDTPQEVVTDAHGRTVELREYLRDPDANATADLPAEVRALTHQSTKYTFDVAGRMTQMENPAGKIWSYVYDWNGSQTSATDPDAGTSLTTYDVAGQMLTHTNGNGETLAYTYDGIGRKTVMKELHEGAPATLRATWAYDNASFTDNEKVLGQVSSSTRYVDGAQYITTTARYDDAYRPLDATVSLPDTPVFAALDSRTFTTAYRYTTGGQVASVSLPAVTSGGVTKLGGEVVTTRYDTASQPSWMGGGFGWGTYVAESRFTSDGRPLIADLGNTYGAITSYQYEDGTNRLLGVALNREGYAGTALNIHYGYDSAGNMTSMVDQPTATAVFGAQFQDNQCFGYDGLRRLQVAWTAGDGDCAVAQGDIQASDVGGVEPYWSEYQYDSVGNRTSLTEHGLGSSPTSTTEYEHGGIGVGPHQLTKATKTVGGTDTVTNYTYDDAGNRVSAGAVTYQWDAEGELTSVGGNENVYDASGNRLVRSDASGTTVYLPGGQEIVISGTTVSASRYYQFAGSTVATRTGSGLGAVTSLVCDQHGTAVAAVPNTVWTASSVTRVFSDPFGGVRGGSDAGVPGDHRFLGAVSDEASGLTLLGARYYDPVVGTFISVDPQLDTGLTAQFNAYVYSGNNPMTWSDPSGMDWWGDLGRSLFSGMGKVVKSVANSLEMLNQTVPYFKKIVHTVVANPVFVAITRSRDDVTSWISANIMGFKKEPNGDLTSTARPLQILGGYQDDFDRIHQSTCDTAPPGKFEFSDGTTNYVLWAWKGDYLQLGAGAEIGFYSEATKGADGWYDANQDAFIPKMSVNVRGPGGGLIAEFSPSEAQSWVYTSDPSMQGMTNTDLAVTVRVDLSGDPAVLAAFEATWSKSVNPDSPWTIANGVATLNYRRKKKWVR
jgi:RHS repeat-associated protein